MTLTKEFIQKALSHKVWDFGNQVLYDLCASHPHHKNDDEIIAKVWLIGRSYAAAIERRRNKTSTDGDDFYENKVSPEIKKSDIDIWFKELSTSSVNNVSIALKTHKDVTDLFKNISGHDKRSLASKYLHFHFPDRFYIYDSRAHNGIKMLTDGIGRLPNQLNQFDDVYARFFLRCKALNNEIIGIFGRKLSPRELDKVLLEKSKA